MRGSDLFFYCQVMVIRRANNNITQYVMTFRCGQRYLIGSVLVSYCSLWACAITKWVMWHEAPHLELLIDAKFA